MRSVKAARAMKTLRYMGHFGWSLCVVPLALERQGRLSDEALLRQVKAMAEKTFEVFGVPFEVWGQERLSAPGPYIYIANHRSWLDQPAVILAAPGLLHFLGKADYFKMPVLGTTLRLFRCLPVRRDQPGALVEVLSEALAAGGSFVLYPEGTRSSSGEFLSFRSGAYVLSAKTGVAIVPLYVHGTHEVLPRARPFLELEPGPVGVEVGQPFVVPPEFVHEPDVEPYRAAFIKAWEQSARLWSQRRSGV